VDEGLRKVHAFHKPFGYGGRSIFGGKAMAAGGAW